MNNLDVITYALVKKLIEQGGGTTVIANPELAGDEDSLTSIQIGEIAYKIGDSAQPVQEITYSELVALRDNSELVPGQSYRITDYVTKATYVNVSTANHQFDVIVKAKDTNTLFEEAKVALHEGDTYFANNNLDLWEIKYLLDNDTSKYAWADTTNGKGVIYYMKDEFKNECFYDFKNILFSAYLKYTNVYTFNKRVSTSGGAIDADASLLSSDNCYENVLIGKPTFPVTLDRCSIFYYSSSSMNFDCYCNYIDYDSGVWFGLGCHHNIIGKGSTNGGSSHTFGNYCSYNTIKDYCNNALLQNRSSYNTIGENCLGIELYTGCYHIKIGDRCHYIKIGIRNATYGYFEFITVDNDCEYITITASGDSYASYARYVHVYPVCKFTGSTEATLTISRGNNIETSVIKASDGKAYSAVFNGEGYTYTALN